MGQRALVCSEARVCVCVVPVDLGPACWHCGLGLDLPGRGELSVQGGESSAGPVHLQGSGTFAEWAVCAHGGLAFPAWPQPLKGASEGGQGMQDQRRAVCGCAHTHV